MQGSDRVRERRSAGLAGAAFLCLVAFSTAGLPATVYAGAIDIESVSTTLKDDVYYLDASIDYRISEPIKEAIQIGVAVTFVLEIEISRHRDYVWDERVAKLIQRYQIVYHALTNRYLLRNINSNSQHSFPSLESAVAVLGAVVDLPVLDSNLLTPGEQYEGRMMAYLDVDELPVPLRLRSYVVSEWRMSSEWYAWPIPF